MTVRPRREPATAADTDRVDRLAALTTATLLGVAGTVLTLGLLLVTGAAAPGTLADPGPATTVGLPLARYLQVLLGVLAVGCTLVPVLSPHEAAAPVRLRAARLLGPVAAALAVVTVAVYLLSASDLSGRPLPLVLTAQVQQAFVVLPQARAQLLVLLAALVLLVAARTRAARSAPARAGLLAVASAGLLPPGFAGHSASAVDHELAVATVSVHVVAGALWVGGLAVLAVLVLADGRVGTTAALPAVRSFSTLALWCVVLVGASGVLNGALRVSTVDQLTGSAYGLLLLGKSAALLVLVGFGWWHRRHSVRQMSGGAARPAFVRLVVLELLVMVLTVAAAVVLARTAPPVLPGG